MAMKSNLTELRGIFHPYPRVVPNPFEPNKPSCVLSPSDSAPESVMFGCSHSPLRRRHVPNVTAVTPWSCVSKPFCPPPQSFSDHIQVDSQAQAHPSLT